MTVYKHVYLFLFSVLGKENKLVGKKLNSMMEMLPGARQLGLLLILPAVLSSTYKGM